MKKNIEKIKKANQLQLEKKFDAAEKLYLEIIEGDSESPDANHNLSILMMTQKRFKEAGQYISKFINTPYPVAEYFHTAARYYEKQNEIESAFKALDRAITISDEKNILKSYFLKAQLYKSINEHNNAHNLFKKCYEIAPKNPNVLNSYGVSLCLKEKFIESIPIFKLVTELKPTLFDGHINLGLALQKTNRTKDALNSYKKALSINSNHLILNINIGALYQEVRNAKQALKYYEIAKKIDPNFSEIYNNIGIIYGEIGEKQKSFDNYKKALAINPSYAKAFRHLSQTKLLKANDPIIKKMQTIYKNPITSDEDKIEIAFGLGTVLNEQKKFSESFKFFDEGNKLIKKTNKEYNIKEVEKNIKKMLSLYPGPIILEEKSDYSPIFILGMPRSGSTLLENVITNHPDIDSMGELSFINDLATRTKKNNKFWPEIINELSINDLKNLRNIYLDRVIEISPNVKNTFTDKMPYNFLYIGLIKSIFPSSKIIYTSRDSRDNCLSIYFLKLFGSHKYSYDQKTLAEYYNIHSETMKSWFKIYPNQIYHFKYEEFINNPKDESKKLFKYLGFNYKKNYERFDLNNTMTRTASNHQVREKINSHSIGKWKNYNKELSQLINKLNKDTYVGK
jgi:tetratricopeptide (TPR) repeat protein